MTITLSVWSLRGGRFHLLFFFSFGLTHYNFIRGFVNPKFADAPPDMLEHETVAASTLLKLLDKTPDDKRFERVLVGLVNRYLRQDRILAAEQTFKPKTKEGEAGGEKRSDSQRELSALTPIVLLALRGVLEFR